MRIAMALLIVLALPGCVTSIVKDVVTAPIKIVSKTADVLTTSQSESDEKRGRAMRQREENLGKMARQSEKLREKCNDGDEDACSDLRRLKDSIAAEQDRSD